MGNNDNFIYEYKGSQFHLKQRVWYLGSRECMIEKIVTESESLFIPDTCQGNIVVRLDLKSGKKKLPTVRFLFIPASITDIFISNRLFPHLERIEVQPGNKNFSTDGKMLFSADGKRLLYSLVAGNQEQAVVPKTVRTIEREAFCNSACTEIIFENPNVSVENDAFTMSAWQKEQGDYCIVGNMFYRLNKSLELLEVPKNIKRFHEKAFEKARPKHIITPVVPSRNNIFNLNVNGRYSAFEELTITHSNAAINFKSLSQLSSLKKIHILGEHKKYCSEDGVIFTNDKKCLVFYPSSRQDKQYQIPNGTVKIAREAFSNQHHLEEVYMPDTVKMLGMSAFYCCKALRKVQFSDNIKEIPDSSAYQNGGVFQSCKSLCKVTLPQKLQYLGSFAFYNCGLQKVTINDKLKQIGEYAFAECKLQQVSLPVTVERLGKGALAGVGKIDAYVGTAKGLVPAINTVPPNVSENRMNIEWNRCMVYARHKKGDKTESFFIPQSLKLTSAYHLDMAWNNDQIDYEEYDACFEGIKDTNEKLEFAELGILRLKGEEDTPYITYMKHSALRIASHLLDEKKEQEFLAFLKKGYLSESALEKLLKIANKNGLTTCSAYLLQYQNAQGGKKTRRFSL